MNFCTYKAWILVHTIPLYSNLKLIAFWKYACILHDTGLELCHATVSSIKRIVHRYIQTYKVHPTRDTLICAIDVRICLFYGIVINIFVCGKYIIYYVWSLCILTE